MTTTTPAVTYKPPTPSIQVSVREPAIQIIAVGGTVRFYCDARTVSARVSYFMLIMFINADAIKRKFVFSID